MPAPITVLVLTNDLSLRGGTNRVVTDLIWALHSNVRIEVVTLEGGPLAYPMPPGIVPVRLLAGYGRGHPALARLRRTLGAVPGVAGVVRRIRPDVIVSFLARANLVNVLARHLYRLPYRSVICERNFNALQYASGAGARALGAAMRLAYPLADLVIANAEDLAASLRRDFGVPAGKIRVISNPFDLSRIRRLAEETGPTPWDRDGVPVILNVARLEKHKDQATLLAAFATLRSRTPCRLTILGEGPLSAALGAQAKALGIASDVAFPGWDENPFRYMRKAAVCVLSSQFEGFPSVLVEAMTCGCPVVSTECPSGPREITDGGRCGLLVPVGDPAALADAVTRVLRDPALAAELSRLGRARAEDFRADRVAEQFEEALRG